MYIQVQDKETFELFLTQPLPGMGKFVLHSNSDKKPYELHHYSECMEFCILKLWYNMYLLDACMVSFVGGYSTNDILECKQIDQFRVLGRKERTIFDQGVWSSLSDIENHLVNLYTCNNYHTEGYFRGCKFSRRANKDLQN